MSVILAKLVPFAASFIKLEVLFKILLASLKIFINYIT